MKRGKQAKREMLSARVLAIRYSTPESLWKVLSVETDEGNATVVGEFHEVQEGLEYKFHGQWDVHPRYGEQFRAESYYPAPPQTRRGMIAYLSSGLIRGIGPKMAQRIVERFGDETFSIINQQPERLLEVPGIAQKKKEQLVCSFRKHRALQDVVTHLTGLGLSANMAVRLYQEYGDDTVAVIREDPYRLTRDIFGIGFKRADEIASAAGIDPRSPKRLRAAIVYVLQRAADSQGHTFLPREQVLSYVNRLLGTDQPTGINDQLPTPEDIKGALLMADTLGLVHSEGDAIYLPNYFDDEQRVAQRLIQIQDAGVVTAPPPQAIDAAVRQIQQQLGLTYADEQKEAVAQAFRSGVLVITGGPGTGKTTIIRGILEAAESLGGGLEVLLAAPTGRAARKLGEVAERPAQTIHRLLGYGFVEGRPVFRHDANEPLEGDVLIVDETSMVDIQLARHLLEAVPDAMRVIFVGDADQLPSVGPGRVLGDLVSSTRVPVVRLTKIFRQEEVSDIVLNAHRINHGQPPRFESFGQSHFVNCRNPESICQVVVKLVDGFVHREKYPLEDIQVLSPMHRGPSGVSNLNVMIQKQLNPPFFNRAELAFGGVTYRPGDKVMCLRNNYEKGQEGIFNGNLGRVVAVRSPDDSHFDEDTLEIDFDGERIYYGRSELNELMLAYASTVHKSQGSEFPVVIVVVSTSHYIMLQRNLIYTAVTRAQKQLVVVGQPRALQMAVRNNRVRERFSNLASRIS